MGMWDLPQPGAEPMPPEVEAQSVSHWTSGSPKVNMYFNERVFYFQPDFFFLNCDWFLCRNHMFWKNRTKVEKNLFWRCYRNVYNDMTVLDFLTGVLLMVLKL